MIEPQIETIRELKHRWDELEVRKSNLKSRCEQYAKWTLPYLYPYNGANESTEFVISYDSIGARGVNHLANKIVMTLFPSQTAFFRLKIDSEMQAQIKALMVQGSLDPEQAEAQLTAALAKVDEELVTAEKAANEKMDMVAYRPQAVMAAKHLIVTGNSLMFHPEKGAVQQIGLKDYCVVRDISGEVIELMTRDCKAFETFAPAVQARLKDRHLNHTTMKPYQDKSDVIIYTQVRLENDGKYHMYQCADFVLLDTEGAVWPKDKLPWIVLAWNLVHGEDYGRGLVEEYAGAFHNLEVLSGSLLNLAAIMGDIKFLVNPNCLADIAELNRAPSGSYHSGKEGDITAIQLQKQNDAQFIAGMIDRYEKQISDAFLLASTRNAERVTAEEIRMDAQELETSNGGIYSRLANTWQYPTANIILDQIGFEGIGDGIIPQVITGMDSLSRLAELDNYRLFMSDLILLNEVPEDVRGRLKLSAYMAIIGQARQVDYKVIVMSDAEFQAKQDALMQQQQAQIAQEQEGQVAVAAGQQAVKETA